jgi:hypothetical protein
MLADHGPKERHGSDLIEALSAEAHDMHARCRTCAALLQTPQGPCPICSSKGIDVVPDVIELAIEQTLEEDGTLELVRSAAARRMLAPIGPVAALLRW